MRVAKAFNRPDVDQFMDELDADQYAEWCDFFQLEPTGWQAIQMAVARLTWAVIQPHSKKKLKERAFLLKTSAAAVVSDKVEKIRWQAAAISSQIRERIKRTGK